MVAKFIYQIVGKLAIALLGVAQQIEVGLAGLEAAQAHQPHHQRSDTQALPLQLG